MFESIVSKIVNTVRAVGIALQNNPWLAGVVMLALVVVW